jgi:hypothetical protein
MGFGLYSGDFYSIGFGMIGWIFAGLMVTISYHIEKDRFDTMISVLEQIITVHNRRYRIGMLHLDNFVI